MCRSCASFIPSVYSRPQGVDSWPQRVDSYVQAWKILVINIKIIINMLMPVNWIVYTSKSPIGTPWPQHLEQRGWLYCRIIFRWKRMHVPEDKVWRTPRAGNMRRSKSRPKMALSNDAHATQQSEYRWIQLTLVIDVHASENKTPNHKHPEVRMLAVQQWQHTRLRAVSKTFCEKWNYNPPITHLVKLGSPRITFIGRSRPRRYIF
jgi:hypothetical protein